MKKFDVSEICGRAWAVFTENWLMFVGVYVVIFIVQSAISSLLSPSVAAINYDIANVKDPMEQLQYAINQIKMQPGQFVGQLCSRVIEFGLIIMMFGIIKGKIADFTADSWKQSFMSYVNYIAVTIVVGLIVGIGVLCCILPGIWLASRLMFAKYAIANNPQMTFTEAIKHSWEITEGNSLNIILLICTCIVICIGGLLCCCVGILPSAIVVDLISCVAYLTLLPTEEEASAE